MITLEGSQWISLQQSNLNDIGLWSELMYVRNELFQITNEHTAYDQNLNREKIQFPDGKRRSAMATKKTMTMTTTTSIQLQLCARTRRCKVMLLICLHENSIWWYIKLMEHISLWALHTHTHSQMNLYTKTTERCFSTMCVDTIQLNFCDILTINSALDRGESLDWAKTKKLRPNLNEIWRYSQAASPANEDMQIVDIPICFIIHCQ